jgi:hypothetical protein
VPPPWLGVDQGRSHHQAPWLVRSRQALAGGSPSLYGCRSSRRDTPPPGRRGATAAARARASVAVFPRMRDGSPTRVGTDWTVRRSWTRRLEAMESAVTTNESKNERR